MVFCMAFGCSNKNDAYERGVSFHRLPLNQAALLEQWLVSMRLENPHVTQHARVCSDHFSPGCYLPDKKLDLGMGGKRKRLLKPNAVPTLFDFHKVTKMNSRSTKRIRIEHFVGGRGPTPEHPDPVPFNPLNAARPESSRFQANIAGFGVSGEPSGTSSVVDPSVSIQEVKPHIVNRLDLDLVGPPNSLPHPAPAPANRNPSYTFRPSFAQQRIARAQQIHHGNSQVASRPGMQSRPPQGLQSRPPQGMQSRPPQGMQPRARMPAPSATVTSAAPPLKRPRLETQRAVPQTNRQMGQAPVQRQNMSTFDQSHRMPAPRSVVRSPQRPIGVQQMSTQQARPMQHRQVSRSPQRQIARSKQQISQSRNSEPKSDSTERAFLNPDHSSHIMTELSALWKSGKFVDAAIMVGGMKLQAHRMVLFAASPYLRASFDHLNPATELRLKMPSDIKLDIVYQFLTYIYDGILRLNPNNAFSLLKISLMLRMEHLTMCCQEYMTYAVNSGTIPPMAVKDVKSPLLVLVDQKAQETGQGKADMCTQTMSDSEPSTIRSPPKVDFDRVFGEDDHATSSYHSNQFDHSVQSDMDLYQNYDQGLGDGGGGGRVVHTQDDGDAMPMIIVKNECIDPEYELSINPPHLTSPPPDLDNMSPASNQSEPRSDTEQHMSSQTDPLPDTDISSPAAQAGVEAMQVVPGIDLDVSSPDTPDHDLEQSTNGSVHQSPLTSTFDQSQVGTSAFDQSQVSTSAFDQSTSSTSTDQLHSLEQSSVSQSETNGTPSYTFTSESNIAEGYESFPDRTSDNSHTNTEDQTSAFTQSAPDQSLPLVESGDHATPQFGTEEFLSSDFDVQMSNAPKSEPDDPV
ncbi:uncharacterized protein LOC124116851 isoform X5 [Haliotis rufescens]|uniref:uncharacterized protein LOC124116851 isoform X5 n=1 Tax=Haliotis rufescens TaxID=6454 RepID=UPI00201F885A|nr:uncharacterized protein LOC124116851 isoform X5 [Haliotis rufescens]